MNEKNKNKYDSIKITIRINFITETKSRKALEFPLKRTTFIIEARKELNRTYPNIKQIRFFPLTGRTRLEPISIVILSVIMCAASVMVIYDAIKTIANDASYFLESNTTATLSEIDMSPFPISVMCFTAVSKAILFFLCYRVKNPTMSALAEDHRNDVASNLIALGCGLVGKISI